MEVITIFQYFSQNKTEGLSSEYSQALLYHEIGYNKDTPWTMNCEIHDRALLCEMV